MYLVKKYHNRKLYLPAGIVDDKKIKGRYITSKQLLELDKENGVKVIDNQTKSDITDETILSAIYELAKVDPNARALVLNSFNKEENLLTIPTFLFETKEKNKKDIPVLNTSQRTINEDVVVPETTPIAKNTSDSFSGF